MRLDVCPNPVSLEVTTVRKGASILALSLLLVTVLGLAMPATALGGDSMITRVVVVVTPPLSWLDVTSGEMPATRALADSSATALLADHEGDPATALAKRFATALPANTEVVVASGGRAEIDATIGSAVASARDTDLLIVVTAASGPDGRSQRLGFVLMRGDAYASDLLTSASTHRIGLVTADDVIGSAGEMLGMDTGSSAGTIDDDRTPEERSAHLSEMDSSAAAAERMRVPLFMIYTSVMVVLLCGGWLLAEGYRNGKRFAYWSLVMRRAILFGLSIPAGATLVFAVDRYPSAVMRIVSLMLAASGFVWIIAEFAWHRWGTAGALGLVGTVTGIVFGVDQLLGAPLSFSGIFSYSPIAAFRFYGIGNEGAAILVGAALVGVSLELDGVPVLAARRRLVIAGTGALAVALCALPFFGANVIVAVWGTLTFGALYLAAEQRRPRAAHVVTLGAAVIVVVAAAVLLDRMVGGGTHIGRAVSDVSTGGIGGLIASRVGTSVRILTSSPLPSIVLAVAGVVAYVRVRPRGENARVLAKYPMFAAGVTAGLVGGVVGALVEDSGVVVLALILTYLVGALVMLMLEPEGEVGV